MKYIFLFLFSLSLHAGSLLVNTCINNNYYVADNILYYQEQNTTSYTSTSISNIDNIKDGYLLTSNGCERTLKYGLEIWVYDSLMAFSGVLIGFMILFLILWGI